MDIDKESMLKIAKVLPTVLHHRPCTRIDPEIFFIAMLQRLFPASPSHFGHATNTLYHATQTSYPNTSTSHIRFPSTLSGVLAYSCSRDAFATVQTRCLPSFATRPTTPKRLKRTWPSPSSTWRATFGTCTTLRLPRIRQTCARGFRSAWTKWRSRWPLRRIRCRMTVKHSAHKTGPTLLEHEPDFIESALVPFPSLGVFHPFARKFNYIREWRTPIARRLAN